MTYIPHRKFYHIAITHEKIDDKITACRVNIFAEGSMDECWHAKRPKADYYRVMPAEELNIFMTGDIAARMPRFENVQTPA